ncbi:MAG: sodium:solute symporter family protein [Saprospiraceae bacterium]|nr:sodium:solute symporter family protein [Saprospiraceae bacterium]
MLLLFIGLYLLLTILLGLWASRKVHTTRDFVVAGRKMPMLIAASALFATWFGSETILGSTSAFLDGGLIAVVEDPFGAALCLMLTGAFFARKLYRLNILTFNDYYRNRYGPKTELVSALFMIPSYFGWIAAQLVAMAIILQSIAGVPFLAGILLCTVVVLTYTVTGGMWSVSITDFVQTIMIIVGLVVLFLSLLSQSGGWQPVAASLPDGFFRFTPASNTHAWAHYLAAWITIGLGSIPQQDIFQRVMSARSETAAVQSSWTSGFLYLTIGILPLAIVLTGRFLYPDLQVPDDQYFLPSLVLQHGSLWLQVLFFGALLSAILSTTSGAMLAPATVLGENIIRPRMKNLDDADVLRIIRYSIVLVAVLSAIMASWRANIYELVAESSALSLVSLFVPLTAGFYWKRARAEGAMLSMIGGMAVWLTCTFLDTAYPPLLFGLAASISGMVIGSLWLSRGTSQQQGMPIK